MEHISYMGQKGVDEMKKVSESMKMRLALIAAAVMVLLSSGLFQAKAYAAGRKVSNPRMVSLNLNRTYTAYDVTGDGRADRVRFSGRAKSGGYVGLALWVNGKKYTLLKASGGRYNVDYFDLFAKICTLSNGKPFLFINPQLDNEDGPISALYRMKKGRLQKVIDFNTYFKGGYTHTNTRIIRVSGSSLTFRLAAMNMALGYTEMDFRMKYFLGNLRLSSRKGSIVSICGSSPRNAKALRRTVKLYRTAGASKSSIRIAKGTKVRVTKVYVGKKVTRFYLKPVSGKGGWFQNPASYRYGMKPILAGTGYSG